MRRRHAAIVGVAILGVLGWFLWPEPEVAEPADPPALARMKKRIRAVPKRAPRLAPAPLSAPVDAPLALPVPEDELAAEVGRLVVDVTDEEGRSDPRARVWVAGCQAEGVGDGMWRAPDGALCRIEARRRDGALYARAVEAVAVVGGDTTYVQLELPSARTGGLGVQVAWDGGAIRVQRVIPGTPAALQGLEAGDRIVEVDGVPVGELGVQGFIARMTGPEGTDVHFVLEYEDEEGVIEEEVAITRAFFDT